jgi:lipid-A-disaccharide synthase
MTRLFLIAGEPSGDRLGASLMAGLKELQPDIAFKGIGGPLMQAEGLNSLFPMSDLSVMGLAEVLPKLPKLLSRIKQTVAAVDAAKPDALITIDSPDFCLRVAAKAKAANPSLKTIHYVAPTVWAWRPERAVKMARHIDHVLALLPFEPPYMQAEGMGCDFVGHPVATETVPDKAAQADFRASLGITPNEEMLLVLPGSRAGEVARMGPVFGDVVKRVHAARPDTRFVVPAVGNVADRLQDMLATWPNSPILLDPRNMPPKEAEVRKSLAFAAADLALAASGTVSLELAAMGTPMVIAYRFNWLTTRIVKKKVRLDTATLVNILTDTMAVPEFLFEACTAGNITPKVLQMLEDKSLRNEQQAAADKALDLLGRGGAAPGLRAAKAVLATLSTGL